MAQKPMKQQPARSSDIRSATLWAQEEKGARAGLSGRRRERAQKWQGGSPSLKWQWCCHNRPSAASRPMMTARGGLGAPLTGPKDTG
ncbi:uncharacterized protein CIMG_12986 [Coccidioides immitis RS]|uniref:Uncharacterized protein n=1 Tax=Coccidioides immitis (strain RS) TaxID=246410 RepID=A0A0D8JW04_COCIM|nr:uncharacterized protein CIMG_12986 [Coccidioides immitis RS]KJF60468.1 hypothetical protein CIMG_12986 [Coccidioides immitis RS]